MKKFFKYILVFLTILALVLVLGVFVYGEKILADEELKLSLIGGSVSLTFFIIIILDV